MVNMEYIKVLLLVGKKGAGKSEFVNIARDKGIRCYELGDIVKESMMSKGIEINNENIRSFMIDERKRFGYEIFAKRLYAKVIKEINGKRNGKDNVIIISGIRSIEEITFFLSKFKHVLIVEIRASDKKRFLRIKKRKKLKEKLSYQDFLKIEEKEKEVGIEKAIKKADIVIENEGTKEAFKKKTLDVLNFLLN
jgi:dephospho-CoA kinase